MFIQQILLIVMFLLPTTGDIRREYTPVGNIIERKFHNYSDYTLQWGTKNFMRSLPDTFTIAGLNNPYFWYENNQYVLLKINAPKYRSSVMVLPLNDSLRVQYFSNPLGFNGQSNMLAYSKSPHTINFIDLTSGAKSYLNIKLPHGAKDLIKCVNFASLKTTELHLRWIETPPSAISIYQIPKLK